MSETPAVAPPPPALLLDPAAQEAARAVHARAGVWEETSSRARVRLTGRDRVKFLQNVTSQDVKALAPGETALTAALTMKAKLVGLGWVHVEPAGEALRLDIERACAEALLAHLRKYVVVNQVRFEDVTEGTASIAIEGPEVEAVLAAVLAASGPGAAVLRYSLSGESGVRVHVPRERAGSALDAAQGAGATRVPAEAVEALRVEGGTPRFGADMDETTFPPEARLDASAISYVKGCFLGQEPIARLHFMGHINKRLMGFRVAEGAAAPAVGMSIHAGAAAAPGPAVGRITSVARSPSVGGFVALGYLRKEHGAGAALVALPAPPAASPAAPIAIVAADLPLVAPARPHRGPASLDRPNVPPRSQTAMPGGSAEGGALLPGGLR